MLLEACISENDGNLKTKLTPFKGASKLRQLESVITWEGKNPKTKPQKQST